jgi:hypothetical protein
MSEHDELNKLLKSVTASEKAVRNSQAKRRAYPVIAKSNPMFSDDEDGKDEDFLSSYVHWTSSDGRVFVPAAPTVQLLTPGVYEIDQSANIGLYFEKIPVRCEGLLRFPDTNSDRVVAEIQKFWEREDVFRDYGLTYKRGILLYGPPGSGKSCTIQLIMADVVSRNGIVVKFTDPDLFIDGMRVLRQIQADTPVVVIMEDIDSTLEIFNESEILNILDGVNEVNKVVFLATTNYPEKLGARIVNRPSRFDKRFRIGYPSEQSRRMYFEHIIAGGDPLRLQEKIKELKINLNQWVEDTDGMSIAHLKELFIQVVIIGDTYEESIQTLQSMTEVLQDKEYESSMGFGTPKKTDDYYN